VISAPIKVKLHLFDLLWIWCGLVVDKLYNISTCCGFSIFLGQDIELTYNVDKMADTDENNDDDDIEAMFVITSAVSAAALIT